jgi:hypothetical protein
MADQPAFDQQHGSGTKQEVVPQVRFGFDYPSDHAVARDSAVAWIGSNLDVIEPTPSAPDTQAG